MKKRLMVLSCLALVMMFSPASLTANDTQGPTTPAFRPQISNDLIAHWRFDEGSGITVSDATGKGHTGTVHGASWNSGKVGMALSFDGQDDYVQVPNASDLSGMNQLTIEAWVYPKGLTHSWQKIIHKPGCCPISNANISYTFFWRERPGIGPDRYANSFQNQLGVDYSINLTIPPTSLENSWHHFALTYDGSAFRAYVDGTMDVNWATASGLIRATTSPLFIGTGYSWSSMMDFFYGYLDEVKLFSRALSATEIAREAGVLIPATVNLDPNTINLKTKAQWVTAYIVLPTGYNVADIALATVRLEGTIPAITDPKYDFVTNPAEYLVDHDGDGVLERMVKFDGPAVRDHLKTQGASGATTLTVTGRVAGTSFEGRDTIKVLR